ncbi:MAG: sulfur carrier protein ThiS [Bariatricus sp.]|nr:sulfur carrier protein ThiS [Bariatricus sp.]
MIHITANGVLTELESSVTVTEFLESRKYTLARIAVELNGAILPKSEYSTTILTEADTMEVVTFVGGG